MTVPGSHGSVPGTAPSSAGVVGLSFTITSTVFADVPMMAVTIQSPGIYKFDYWAAISSVGSPTPTIGFGINGPPMISLFGTTAVYLSAGGTSTAIAFVKPFTTYNQVQTLHTPATTHKIHVNGMVVLNSGGILMLRAMRGSTAGATLMPLIGSVEKIG